MSRSRAAAERTRYHIVAFIQAFYEDNRNWPTFGEIAHGLGLSSRGQIHHHLDILRSQGHVTWEKHQVRSIRVVKPVRPWKGARRESESL